MYLLDTDTLIYFLKGHKTVVQNFKANANKPKAISVVTNNTQHFQKIPGLKLANWA